MGTTTTTKKKAKFKVNELVMITSQRQIYKGKTTPRHKYGAGYYVVLKVDETAFGDIRYTVVPHMSNEFMRSFLAFGKRETFSKAKREFAPWGYTWEIAEEVYENELRPYQKSDMDREYCVTCNGDEMYRGKSRKEAMSYKANNPFVHTKIEETDLNRATSKPQMVWTNIPS